jgi:predicted DNA-binding ribbon-helix-helix protein
MQDFELLKMRTKKPPMIPRGIMLEPCTWTAIEAIANERSTSIGAVVRSIVNESIANKKTAKN